MKRKQFDHLFMDLAFKIAEQSHCVKKKVGAILTKDTRIISTGYNGPPKNTLNCDEDLPESGCERSFYHSCFFALHAEYNAMIYAINNGSSVKDSILYVTLSPCLYCAKLIFSLQIQQVVYMDSYSDYKEQIQDEGILFLKTFGVEVKQYEPNRCIEDTLP